MPSDVPQIAYYGDDFTGATDTLATATQAGLRTLLFLRVPSADELDAAGPLDCLGIAGTSRSLDKLGMRRELEPVTAFFRHLGAKVIHYKTCSTFDSAPEIGSIGLAASILRRAASNPFLPIVGGQPNLNRYCLFGNLFAAAGTGGEVHRIDRHPTMSVHPVTPMTEGDLRRHLAAQGLAKIGLVDYRAYAGAGRDVEATVARLLEARPDAVLLDVAHADDLPVIGRLIWRYAAMAPLLAIGPSSVVEALARGRANPIAASGGMGRVAAAASPVFVLSGSLSPVTRQQLQSAPSYVPIAIDATHLMDRDSAYIQRLHTALADALRQGRNVLAYTTPAADGNISTLPARDLALACGELVLKLLQTVPLHRIGIAGGDTSSYALKALDIWGLSYRGALAPGVALCRAHSTHRELDGVELMLKGGQMGPPDIFERLLHGTWKEVAPCSSPARWPG